MVAKNIVELAQLVRTAQIVLFYREVRKSPNFVDNCKLNAIKNGLLFASENRQMHRLVRLCDRFLKSKL